LRSALEKPNDPNFDRIMTALGSYTLTQSWKEQADNDARVRYGYDLSARTELEKQRLADDAAMNRQGTINQTNLTTSLLVPIGEGAVRHVPSAIAGLYDLPFVQYGNVKASPGERILQPGGGVLPVLQSPLARRKPLASSIGG